THLIEHGQSIRRNNFGATFFILTGFHGMHVFGGVCYLTIILLISLTGRFTPENNSEVEIAGLYWHFVDLVWILVFTYVYLLSRVKGEAAWPHVPQPTPTWFRRNGATSKCSSGSPSSPPWRSHSRSCRCRA